MVVVSYDDHNRTPIYLQSCFDKYLHIRSSRTGNPLYEIEFHSGTWVVKSATTSDVVAQFWVEIDDQFIGRVALPTWVPEAYLTETQLEYRRMSQ
jgi:hypothetical protein